jgi:hypothetical protein
VSHVLAALVCWFDFAKVSEWVALVAHPQKAMAGRQPSCLRPPFLHLVGTGIQTTPTPPVHCGIEAPYKTAARCPDTLRAVFPPPPAGAASDKQPPAKKGPGRPKKVQPDEEVEAGGQQPTKRVRVGLEMCDPCCRSADHMCHT